jgi:hypothetical protein
VCSNFKVPDIACDPGYLLLCRRSTSFGTQKQEFTALAPEILCILQNVIANCGIRRPPLMAGASFEWGKWLE